MGKKEVLRKCLASNEVKNRNDLFRIVRNKEGEVKVDFTFKANGRGAYLCNSLECFQKARKTRGLERSLQVKIPDDIYETLEKELMAGE